MRTLVLTTNRRKFFDRQVRTCWQACAGSRCDARAQSLAIKKARAGGRKFVELPVKNGGAKALLQTVGLKPYYKLWG
ncbi:MAG: hypothetical protein KME26_22065 [Oscillatoria princeps RMCB-10]|nr:hypothetical protein [Oscillatoria princeps RMCB-10]